MKILKILIISIALWCVITKETKNSNLSSEKVTKTEVQKTEEKNLKTEEKNTKSEKKSQDVIDPNIGKLFPVTQVNIKLNNLPEHEGFQSAEIMSRIPLSLNQGLNTGEIVPASETLGKRLYYDGRDNLNAIHVNCSSYSLKPQLCVGNAQCGWCGQNNSCIPGTPSGPLAPCFKDTFLYSAENPNWNPFRAGTVNIRAWDDKKRSQIIVAPTPDVQNMNVWAPYH